MGSFGMASLTTLYRSESKKKKEKLQGLWSIYSAVKNYKITCISETKLNLNSWQALSSAGPSSTH